MNTQELLISAKARSGARSWRALAAMLGVAPCTVNGIRHGIQRPGDELCLEIAQLAGVDPYTALLQLNAERSEGKARRLYEKVLRERSGTSIAAE
jgi:transcriptional regulator with XRE-family HTH domain